MTDLTERCDPDQVTGAQARAAHVTYLLVIEQRSITTAEIMERTGLTTPEAVWHMMNNLSRGRVPVYNPAPGTWALLRDDIQAMFE